MDAEDILYWVIKTIGGLMLGIGFVQAPGWAKWLIIGTILFKIKKY